MGVVRLDPRPCTHAGRNTCGIRMSFDGLSEGRGSQVDSENADHSQAQ